MYLKRLFKFNRLAGTLASLYLIGFIYLNYKWGFVATPILQYGMYSQPVKIQGDRTIYQVEDISGKEIMNQLHNFQRDQINHYLEAFSAAENNEHARSVFLPILTRLRLSDPPRKFGIETHLWQQSAPWLICRIKKWVSTAPLSKFQVRLLKTSYSWNGTALVPTATSQTLFKDEQRP